MVRVSHVWSSVVFGAMMVTLMAVGGLGCLPAAGAETGPKKTNLISDLLPTVVNVSVVERASRPNRHRR